MWVVIYFSQHHTFTPHTIFIRKERCTMKHLRFSASRMLLCTLAVFLALSTCAFADDLIIAPPAAFDPDAVDWTQATLADDMSITGNFAQGYTVNNWYSSGITINGGVSGYTYNITDGSLPPGFYIRLDGAHIYLEGIPNQAGKYTFTIRITDRRNYYAERQLSVTINDELYEADDMSLSSVFTRAGSADVWYSSRVYINGGSSPYTFQITEGSLPSGLYIRQDGGNFYLEGKPSEAGKYTFTFRVMDRRNSYTEKKSTVTITGEASEPEEADDMSISGNYPTDKRVNQAISSTYVSVSGYSGSVTWSIVKGTLPPGLSLRPAASGNSYLYISGIPNTGGTYKFTLRATDGRNLYAERVFTIKINDTYTEADDMSINGDFTSGRRINESYSSYITASGYTDSVSWSLVDGELPPGLYLKPSSNYVYLQGIPNTGGTYTFTLKATDNRNYYVERQFTVKVIGAPYTANDMAINNMFTSGRRINESYSSYVYVSGYVDSVNWSVVSGDIPPGMYFQHSGNTFYLRGIPNKAGTYAFIIRATDYRNAYVERPFTVTFIETPYKATDMAINGNYDTNKNINESYSSSVYVSGYVDNVNWSVVSGDIPPGMYFQHSGNTFYLRGIPNKAGTYAFIIRATDYRNAYVERPFTVTINGGQTKTYTAANDMSITGAFAEGYTINNWYSSNVYVSGGTSDYIYNITSGALPPGFFLRRDGSNFYLNGIPNKAGTYKFTLRVYDKRDTYTERDFTVKINGEHYAADDMSINGVLAQGYTVNNWYSSSVQISGGVSGYSYNITEGSLPPGFYYRADGQYIYFNGIPNKAGEYKFKIKVTDRRNAYAERELTLTINGDEEDEEIPIIKTEELDNGFIWVRHKYEKTLELSNDVSEVTWSISEGSLPPGLALDASTGMISGTPEDLDDDVKNGYGYKSFTFTVRASNSAGYSEKEYTMTIRQIFELITDSELPSGYVDEEYSAVIRGTGGRWLNSAIDSFYWNIRNGSLPQGLTLTRGTFEEKQRLARITGVPEETGTFEFEVYVTDTVGLEQDSKKFIITISDDQPATAKPAFKSANLILSGQIGVNFFLDLPDIPGVDYYDSDTSWMDFDINGDSTSNPPQIVDDEFMSNGRHGFRCYVNSVQMADPIEATFHYGNNKNVSYIYAVERYLNSKLKGSGAMRDLAAAIKDYGHYAQVYLSNANGWVLGDDHIAMDAVNTYTASDFENIKQATQQYKAVRDDYAGTGVSSVSYSLSLASETIINLSFRIASGYSGNVFASLNGSAANMAVLQPDGRYLVEITELAAHKLGDTQTVTVSVDGADDFTIQVSALTFTYNTLNSSSSTQDKRDLAAALYKYYQAAINYRNSQ